jgi:hypothetical protein
MGRDVAVTVNRHGQIGDVTFTERVLTRPPDEVAQAVLEAAGQALDNLAVEIERMLDGLSDAEEADAIWASYRGMLDAHRRD